MASVVILLYAPVLLRMATQFYQDPAYSHGFAVPIFSAYLIWRGRDRLAQVKKNPRLIGLGVVLAALGLLFLGSLGAELFLTRISLVLIITGLVLYFFGVSTLRLLAFPICFLLLMIPIPAILYNRMVFPLQILSSQFATITLQAIKVVPVLREGNLLMLPNCTLEVVDACSGIRSLMAIVAFALGYAYLTERSVGVRAFLTLAMVPVAIVGNGMRVVVAALLANYRGKCADDFLHPISGVIIFLVAVVLLLAMHWVIAAIRWRLRARSDMRIGGGPSIGDAGAGDGERIAAGGIRAGEHRNTVKTSGRRFWCMSLILVGATAGFYLLPHGRDVYLPKPLNTLPLSLDQCEGVEIPFPDNVIQRLGVDDYVNRTYHCADGAPIGLYIGYYKSQRTDDTIHSPQNCLPGNGWEPVGSSYVSLKTPEGRAVKVRKYIIEKGLQRQVVLYWYQAHGRTIASEYWAKIYLVHDAIFLHCTNSALIRINTPISTGGLDRYQLEGDARVERFATVILARVEELIP